MDRASFALVIALVACDAGKKSPAPAPPPTPTPADATAVAASPDDAFEQAALRYATGTQRYVLGWGTVKLDGEHPIRFATLSTDTDNARGAYLLELAPARVVVVAFTVNGRTEMFHEGDGVRPDPKKLAWAIDDDQAIEHRQSHHHGGETIKFGLRDGKLVVFEYDYKDEATEKSPADKHEVFVAKGTQACKPACPPLVSHGSLDSQLTVSAEAASFDKVVEPAPAE